VTNGPACGSGNKEEIMSGEPENHRQFERRQLTDLQTEICRLDLDDANFGESLDYILGLAFSLRSQVAYTPRAQVPLTPPNPIGATTTAATTCPKCKAALTVTLS
jgi:hypothetical protein